MFVANSMQFGSNSWLGTLLTGLAAAIATAAILRTLLATGLAWRLATDIPNDRSMHTRPTPRVGGWGIVPVIVAILLARVPAMWLVAVATLGLAAVSQMDDRRGLPARVRFAAHAVAVVALLIVHPGGMPWWAFGTIGLLMLWLINLYNFMDGADGLAGGMALFGFGAYAAAASISSTPSHDLTIAGIAVAGAALGFLTLNFHPAKLFLGDAGSIPFGFLAGALGYWGWIEKIWPVWLPAMVFAPFIADASVTLSRRLLRGERFWEAHREHYYQRMVRLGVGHARTAVYWYAFMLVGSALALGALSLPSLEQWILCIVWYGVLACAGLAIDRRWRRIQAAGSE